MLLFIFDSISFDWLESYLTNRYQFTVVNDAESALKGAKCGVPQGTVLGPLLFLLYINDIPNSLTKSQMKLFADDSNLFVIGNNVASLFNLANNELSLLSQWINANKLFINYDKTNFMFFDPIKRHKVTNHSFDLPPLLLNNHQIERVHMVRYLGILIDDKLSWTEHINYLINRVSSICGILYRTNQFLPMNCKKNIFYALVYSVIIYCIEVYGNVNKTILNPLLVKYNRLLRLLLHKPRRTRLYDLYSSFDTLPINLLFEFFTAKLIHKCLYDNIHVPVSISRLFIPRSSMHSHNTRHSNTFFLNSNCNPKSIMFYGPSMWSKLPSHLQSVSSINVFLRNYKHYLFDTMRT